MANLESKSDCSNLFGFREIAVFMMFSFISQENLDTKKNNRTSISQPYSGRGARVHSGVVNLESNNDCSNPFVFRVMAFFL